MSRNWTYVDLEKTGLAFTDSRDKDKKPVKTPKASKYGNIKTEVDGVVFDSLREANRYKELRMALEQGCLTYLFTQFEFELNDNGKFSYKYFADFVYGEGWNMVVEDCKGMRTATYLKKRKLMKKIYNIEIKET